MDNTTSVFMANHRAGRKEFLIESITLASARHKYLSKVLANYEVELEGVTTRFNDKIKGLKAQRSQHFQRVEEEDPEKYGTFCGLENYFKRWGKFPDDIDDSFLEPIKKINAEIEQVRLEMSYLRLNLEDSITILTKRRLFMEELVLGAKHSAEMEGITLDLASLEDGESPASQSVD